MPISTGSRKYRQRPGDWRVAERPPRRLDDDGATIVVTGALGFVGRHLCAHLADRFPAATIRSAGRQPTNDLRFDLGDGEAAGETIAAARPDVVVHLAGEASVAAAGRDAAETWRVNLGGTLAIADALGRAESRATMLFASSAEVYGMAFLAGAVSERTPPQPASVYAQTKLATEQMLAAVLPEQMTLIAVRPSNHIGPGQSERFAISSFANQIAVGERRGTVGIDVGNLESKRDFLDVRDVVHAYGDLLAHFHGGGQRLTFNLSSGRTRTMRSILDLLIGTARVPCDVRVDQSRIRPLEIDCVSVSSAALHQAVGWQPTIPFEQTVADIMADARQRQSVPRQA